MIDVAWRSLDTDTDVHAGAVERLRLTHDLELRAISMVQAPDWAVRYELVLGSDWRARSLEVESTQGGSLHLLTDGQGGWTVDGVDRPDLAEAVDVDFRLTPFTNTLPIRRLHPEVGDSVEVDVAWVDSPSLEVSLERQVYTRLAERRWRFASGDGEFLRELEVDEHGLIVDYPGMFARIDDAARAG